jgi:hypothetical protein
MMPKHPAVDTATVLPAAGMLAPIVIAELAAARQFQRGR